MTAPTPNAEQHAEQHVEQPAAGRGTSRLGVQFALAAALVSGVAVYLNGRAVRNFSSPTVYTTAKNLVAGLLLVAIAVAWAKRNGEPADRPHRPTHLTPAHMTVLAAIAVIGGAVPFVLFFEGLARATSNDAAFIHKTLIIWAALLATAVLRERLTRLHLVAIAVLVVGYAALAGGIDALHVGMGEAMILGATICWSVEVVLVRRITADVRSTDVAAVRLGGGSLVLVGWVLLRGDIGELLSMSGSELLWIAVTGPMLATFVTLWFAALERAQVVDVTAILVLGAVVTGLLNAVIGNAGFASQIVGDLLIFVGVTAVVAHALGRLSQRPLRWT